MMLRCRRTAAAVLALALTLFECIPAAHAGGATVPPAPVDDNAAIFAGETHDPRRLAQRAYVWGYPLVAAARIRFRFTGQGPGELGTALNQFTHTRRLAGPE